MFTFHAYNNEPTLPAAYHAMHRFRRHLADRVRHLLVASGREFAQVTVHPSGAVDLADANGLDGSYRNLHAVQTRLLQTSF